MTEAPTLIAELAELIGIEHSLDAVDSELAAAFRSLRLPAVGALQVTCSDEAGFEAVESFRDHFAKDLLPRLKVARGSAFRTSNLGGRFERDSLRVACRNFSSALAPGETLGMIVKISAHAGVDESRGAPRFGVLRRYGSESACCGALAAVLEGATYPRARSLREPFESGGVDRLRRIRESVPPGLWRLAVAVLSARLQARRGAREACRLEPPSPLLALIVPTVTLNRLGSDTEIVCGLYTVDRRLDEARAWYRGLGDRPERYEIVTGRGPLQVRDSVSGETRPARCAS